MREKVFKKTIIIKYTYVENHFKFQKHIHAHVSTYTHGIVSFRSIRNFIDQLDC